ncbi:MAG: gliding motility-associated C-terminal domain-containing protein [Bacteroidetes bacterium]|nr:gliding motility-associated C-terminal domain-containing protein [Bacteroidota bacterium]
MRCFITILFLYTTYISQAQFLYYQNTFKGGCSFDGMTYNYLDWMSPDTIYFNNVVPVGCLLKKAFLFSIKLTCDRQHSFPEDAPFPFKYNNNLIQFDSSNNATPYFFLESAAAPSYIVLKDVTSLTHNSNNKVITYAQKIGLCYSTYYYNSFFLLLIYENSTYSLINMALELNSTNYEVPSMGFNFNNLNNIDTNKDVALSINCVDATVAPYLQYQINSGIGSFNIDTINQSSCVYHSSNWRNGAGSFYYQNDTLHGLRDDSNTPFLDTTDAIVNIKSYLQNNANNFFIDVSGTSSGNNFTSSFVLAYSTPCPATPPNADSTRVYTFCNTNTVQLQATSGYASYTWYPATGLSNASVANPKINISSVPSITNYICYVKDTAGCMHTEYARVINAIKPLSIAATTAICGGTQGVLSIKPNPCYHTYWYNLNGGSMQNAATFSNLTQGQYTLNVRDSLGCLYTDTFSIKQINPAQATISAQPTLGLVPLAVSFQDYDYNNTTNIQNWYINGTVQHGKNINYTFTTPGTYSITLIAYNTLPVCSDTAYTTIVVEDSLLWFMPNVFTPNGDGINDVLSITPYYYQSITWHILNRWGNEMISGQQSIDANNPQILLWDGKANKQAADVGTYYYIINLTKTDNTQKILKGFFELLR